MKLSDTKYKNFSSKLIPKTNNIIVGIRIPYLRKISKKVYKGNYKQFLNIVGDKYIEEILIEGFVIGLIKDQNIIDKHIQEFLLKIDNWCVCDTFCSSLKIVKKNMDKYFDFFTREINFNEPFQIRVSLIILNSYYINEEYIDRIFKYISTIKSIDYYVRMSIAWLVSTCYIKFKEKTLYFIIKNTLDDFTLNKSIQKIIESKRITDEEKSYLRKLKK